MDIHATPDAWARLGRALELRRGQLGYGHGGRGRFVRDRGALLSAKTIARLERGERPAYPAATLAVAEEMYRLVPGSIERSLAGGNLEPAADGPPLQRPIGRLSDEERAIVLAYREMRRQEPNGNAEERGA